MLSASPQLEYQLYEAEVFCLFSSHLNPYVLNSALYKVRAQ